MPTCSSALIPYGVIAPPDAQVAMLDSAPVVDLAEPKPNTVPVTATSCLPVAKKKKIKEADPPLIASATKNWIGFGVQLGTWALTGLVAVLISLGAFLTAPDPQPVIEMLDARGVRLERDLTKPDKPVIGVDARGTRFGDTELDQLIAFPQLQHLELGGTAITNRGLLDIDCLRELRSLDVSSTRISDGGLGAIHQFTKLESLNLSFCITVTDIGLARITNLKNLKELYLEGCPFAMGGDMQQYIPGLKVHRPSGLGGLLR